MCYESGNLRKRLHRASSTIFLTIKNLWDFLVTSNFFLKILVSKILSIQSQNSCSFSPLLISFILSLRSSILAYPFVLLRWIFTGNLDQQTSLSTSIFVYQPLSYANFRCARTHAIARSLLPIMRRAFGEIKRAIDLGLLGRQRECVRVSRKEYDGLVLLIDASMEELG